MKNGFFEEHWFRAADPTQTGRDHVSPGGGTASGRGFTISWQNGPLGRGVLRKEPNGAFVEDVIGAVIGRIERYQSTKFACEENAEALHHLRLAAEALDRRTRVREEQGVEGTHEVHKKHETDVEYEPGTGVMKYPVYRCFKEEVQAFKIAAVAFKIAAVERSGRGPAVLVPEDRSLTHWCVSDEYVRKYDPKPGGYWVRYMDGYQSFSPAEAFESGYSPVLEGKE